MNYRIFHAFRQFLWNYCLGNFQRVFLMLREVLRMQFFQWFSCFQKWQYFVCHCCVQSVPIWSLQALYQSNRNISTTFVSEIQSDNKNVHFYSCFYFSGIIRYKVEKTFRTKDIHLRTNYIRANESYELLFIIFQTSYSYCSHYIFVLRKNTRIFKMQIHFQWICMQ